MKRALLAAILLTSGSAFAADDFFMPSPTMSYICTSTDSEETMTLEQMSDFTSADAVARGYESSAQYHIAIMKTKAGWPHYVSEGTAYQSDVQFFFKAEENAPNGQKVQFNMFLDELDQSTLYVGGKKTDYECKTFAEAHKN